MFEGNYKCIACGTQVHPEEIFKNEISQPNGQGEMLVIENVPRRKCPNMACGHETFTPKVNRQLLEVVGQWRDGTLPGTPFTGQKISFSASA